MSGGTVGLQPTYRVLMDNGRGELLWDVLQEPTAPSYANFVDQGRTTIPESWDFAGSQNHMILLQIDEWFNAGPCRHPAGARTPRASTRSSSSRSPSARSATSRAASRPRTAPSRASGRKGANGIASMKV